jgi:hypothetical protein
MCRSRCITFVGTMEQIQMMDVQWCSPLGTIFITDDSAFPVSSFSLTVLISMYTGPYSHLSFFAYCPCTEDPHPSGQLEIYRGFSNFSSPLSLFLARVCWVPSVLGDKQDWNQWNRQLTQRWIIAYLFKIFFPWGKVMIWV